MATGKGFNGGKGVSISFNVDALILHGRASIKLGKVNNVLKFAGSASLRVGMTKGQFGFGLPPKDVNLLSVSFQGGSFTDDRDGKETAGLKGRSTSSSILRSSSI